MVVVPPSFPAHPNEFGLAHSATVVAAAIQQRLAALPPATAPAAPETTTPTTPTTSTTTATSTATATLPRTGADQRTALTLATTLVLLALAATRLRG